MRWIGWGAGGLLALLGITGAWVLGTESGARLALGFVPGLSVQHLEGTLAGPMRLQGVALEVSTAQIQVAELEVDAALLPLLRGAVRLDAVRVRGLRVQVQVQPARTPATASAGPLHLPDVEVRSLDLSDAEVAGVARAPLRIESLRGRIAIAGTGVVLEALYLDAPQVRLHADGALDLQDLAGRMRVRLAPLVGPATLGEIQLALDSDGDSAHLRLQLPGPGQEGVEAVLSDLRGASGYQVSVRSAGFDPAPWGLDLGQALPPVDLQLEGDAAGLRVAGSVRHAEVQWQFDGTQVQWSPTQVRLDPLTVSDGGSGRIHAVGNVGLSDHDAALQLELAGLPLGAWLGRPDLDLDLIVASLRLTGTVLDWQLAGDAHLTREIDDLRLKLDLAGDPQRLQVHQLEVLGALGERVLGRLELRGEMALAAPHEVRADIRADSFNPGTWLPAWPGDVQLQARLEGALDGALRLDLQQLQGELKGAPIRGQGVLLRVPQSPWPQGQLALDIGANTLQWRHAAGGPLELDLALTDLAWFEPAWSGRLQGSVRVPASLQAVEADLRAEHLRAAGFQVEQLRLQTTASTDPQAPLSLQLGGRSLVLAGHSLPQVLLQVQGQQVAHSLSLRAETEAGVLKLDARGGRAAAAPEWQGSVQALEFTPSGMDAVPAPWRDHALRLRAPVDVQVGAARQQWGQACVDWIQAALCTEGEHATDTGWATRLALSQWPLAASRPWTEPMGWVLEGVLDGEGQLAQAPEGPLRGQMRIQGQAVELLVLGTELPMRLQVPELTLELAPEAESMEQVQLVARIARLGRLALQTRLDASDLHLDVDFDSLAALEGLSAELSNLQGQLRGQLRRQGEAWSGEVDLQAFAADLPAANLSLREGRLQIRGAPDHLQLEGQVRSGEGVLTLAGRLDPRAGLAGLDLKVSGQQVLAADLPQARVLLSPDLLIEGRAEQLRISGQVLIPVARIDLARFEPAVAASADVVYVDDPVQAPGRMLPVRADVTVVLGENVELRGFGLDGRLSGRLSVRERPGSPTTARGEINVTGTYKAYGQDLSIERGKLLFANSGLDNPGLDIRAARVVGDIKAGVQVRGSADAPQLTTYASPPMDQLNTISYLVLGRPAAQATGSAGSDAVQNAAQQLGGNLLAKSIGQKLGLEVGIESSAELGGASAFSVGKYLSPRLYVGYGRSLYDQLQLFIVRYQLRTHVELEATSGREQRIGVQYKRER